MGVEELLNDDNTDETVHPKSVKATNPKLRDGNVCPSCGSDNTEEGITFDRCKNSKCDTIMYRHNNFEVDLEKVWD